MSKSFLFRQRVRMKTILRQFARRNEGVAAVEFALIVPIMAVLFIGAVEMSQAVTVNRRVTQVGSTAGDLVARLSGDLDNSALSSIMKTSMYLIDPFPSNNLKIDVSLIMSSSSSATDTKTKWKCNFDSAVSATAVTCTCPDSAFTLPATGMVTTSDSVVIANVSYGYKPKLFDFFMKSNNPSAGGVYTIAETVYLKPRNLTPRIKKADGTSCPS
jgi:Flp pilus assembly protein TadG